MVSFRIILLIGIGFVTNIYCENDFLIRQISNGKILGKQVFSTNGKIYGYAYTGIPYGSPPVGSQRFKSSLEPSNWSGTKNCTTLPKSCIIVNIYDKTLFNSNEMSEDCLYLNVYTSEKCLIDGKCPVVLFVYGGKFVTGSVKKFNETSLIENFANDQRNIVFVNFNYRSGVLGYLALNQKFKLSMDTNVALNDCISVLKWIQKNIHSFGGDKGHVTLMGHSSGAVISSYIYASPKSRGLIHKVIIMSAVHRHVNFKDANEFHGRQVAIQTGCASYYTNWDSINEIENTLVCLRNLSLTQLAKSIKDVGVSCWQFMGPSSDYGPHSVMEYDWKTLSENKPNIPVLIGSSLYELQTGRYLLNSDGKVDLNKLSLYCNVFTSYYKFENQKKFIEECVEEYKNDSIRIMGITDELEIFVSNILLSRDGVNAGSNVFLYQFAYTKTGEAIQRKAYPLTPHHSTELIYVTGLGKNIFTDKDYKIQEYHSRMFTNFIKTSTPSDDEIVFEKYDPYKNNYYNVDFDDNGNTISQMKNNYNEKAIDFWFKKIPKTVGLYYQRSSEKELISFLPIQHQMLRQCIISDDSYLFNYFYTMRFGTNTTLDKNVNNSRKLKDRLIFFILLSIPLILIVIISIIIIFLTLKRV